MKWMLLVVYFVSTPVFACESNEVLDAEKNFKDWDKNGDGVVTFDEFNIYHTEHAKEQFNAIDVNKSGKILWEERSKLPLKDQKLC